MALNSEHLFDLAGVAQQPAGAAIIHPDIASSASSCFTLFPELPQEIQDSIWTESVIHPRIVKIVYGADGNLNGWWESQTAVPAIMHACHSSREIALKAYEMLKFTYTFSGTYINWSSDYIKIIGLPKFMRTQPQNTHLRTCPSISQIVRKAKRILLHSTETKSLERFPLQDFESLEEVAATKSLVIPFHGVALKEGTIDTAANYAFIPEIDHITAVNDFWPNDLADASFWLQGTDGQVSTAQVLLDREFPLRRPGESALHLQKRRRTWWMAIEALMSDYDVYPFRDGRCFNPMVVIRIKTGRISQSTPSSSVSAAGGS